MGLVWDIKMAAVSLIWDPNIAAVTSCETILLCISLVHYAANRPTVHINPSRKRSFLKTFFKPKESGNADFAFKCGR